MRSRAQFKEVALLVEGNLFALRQVFDQLDLVRFILFFVHGDGVFSGHGEAFQPVAFFDDLFHFGFDLVQVLSAERRDIKVVVEAVVDRWSDGQLGVRIQVLDCLR